jgi:hypothetical protein
MSKATKMLGHIWGVEGSRGFKLASWGVAAAVVAGWTYYDTYLKDKSPATGMDKEAVDKLRADTNYMILKEQKLKDIRKKVTDIK